VIDVDVVAQALRQQAHEGQVQGVQGDGLEQHLVGAVGLEHRWSMRCRRGWRGA
jgi:hypothetical protein